MNFLLRVMFVASAVGAVYYWGDTSTFALSAVLMAPAVALMFTGDIMKFFSGSAGALRQHAYDGDARVFRYGYTQVRMIMYRNRAWFEAAPVCEALGHKDVQRSIRHYATTDYCVRGTKKESFLSESGVRRLAAISRSGEAPAFLRWLDQEVVTVLEKTRKRMRTSTQEPLDIDLNEPSAADSPDSSASRSSPPSRR